MSRSLFVTATMLLCLMLAKTAWADPAHILIDDFSSPMPDSPGVTYSVDTQTPKFGLGALKVDYSASSPSQRVIDTALPDQQLFFPTAGKVSFWLRGDGSPNEIQFQIFAGQVRIEPDGRRTPLNGRWIETNRFKLASKEWQEQTIDLASQMQPDNVAWIARMRIYGPSSADKDAKQANVEGSFELDDMKLFPAAAASAPAAVVSAKLFGPAVRDFSNDVSISLDARNFTASAAKMKVRLSMVDRNQNPVADRDFDLSVAARESKEFKLDLAPENMALYLPPFHVTGDVMSTDLPALSARVDVNVVMSNGKILLDNFADVNGRWLTRGYPGYQNSSKSIAQDYNNFNYWLHGEACRAVPWTQTTTRISRVVLDRPAGADPKFFPPDRYAMKLDYTGEAVAYNGFERYLPGNAFKFGIWVRGDGSNSRLIANFLDYSDLADFWVGGWKRIIGGERLICRLDFTGWRYIEVGLPGNGIGSNTLRGSTEGLDFPLELSALIVLPEVVKPPAAAPGAAPTPAAPVNGSILIGPMYAYTQMNAANTLAAMIGYDNAAMEYDPKAGASVSVQNAWRVGTRNIEADWTLSDKDNQPIVSGKQDLSIPAGEIRAFRIELAGEAAKIAPKAGPLRLQVVASDKQDLSINVTREVVLSKPDCVVTLADFESDRGYLGSKFEGITNAPAPGESAAHTTNAQHHSGERSLEIDWDKAKNPTRFVAIDPPIPGVSVDVTMWVKGDGSGSLFYPVIGGPKGVRHGLATRIWNVFIPRAPGDLQDAIRLDFTDWRQFTFQFQAPAFNFDKPLPVLHFLPTYPQGLHLAIDARDATGESGAVFVDDISVRTHLDPQNRMAFSLRRESESNVVRPDAKIAFTASNYDASNPRHGIITGGVYDWRGDRVAPFDVNVDLKPGETRDVVLNQLLPPGAYELRVQMKEGDRIVGSVQQDLLVADLAPILGADWQEALKDPWRLRIPIKDDFTYLDEDWDWVEYYPGNAQIDSMRNRYDEVKRNGAKPWMLLGFAAVWSTGTPYEQMKAGAFVRGYRDVGHGVDIFGVPKRDEDWENYIIEVMRGAGKDIAAWLIWDSPDGTSSVSMPPERFAKLIQIADKWRRVYCPKTPLVIGGMGRSTAVPYLNQLAKVDALSHVNGVNVRMDVGRTSPEDAQVLTYADLLRETLAKGGPDANVILLTELDWAVEKSLDGLTVFDQAAYLTRSDLLLSRAGVKPTLNITNGDYERLGTGLAYRNELEIPPMREKMLSYSLKPGWWAMTRTRDLLSKIKPVDLVPVQDVVPERTRAMLFERTADGRAVVIVWRNDDPGAITFAHSGLAVEAAQDVLGAATAPKDGWYSIGKVPVVFTLGSAAASARDGLGRLWVKDGVGEKAEPSWPQRVVARFGPTNGQSVGYAQTGGAAGELSGRTPTGVNEKSQGLLFANGGSESFGVEIPAGSGLVLRKRYFLDKTGQSSTIFVNGKSVGPWDLKRSEAALSEGVREAVYLIDPAAIGGGKAQIEVKYEGPANTMDWTVLEYRGGDFPLSAMGPVHADQQAGPIRIGRNMIGGPLKIDVETFADGIGAYANSLIEYPLNRQFKRFSAKVGIDSATEGRGSVVFEVWADGKKVYSSGIMSGLDRAKTIDLDVSGVNRLRLVLGDAGDGNKFDAGDWVEPVFKR